MSGKQFRRWYRLKWMGLATCLALLVPQVAPPIEINAKNTAVCVSNGCVTVFHQPVGPGIDADIWGNRKAEIANYPGLLPEYRSVTLRAGKLMYISLPLQLPWVFMVFATSLLWRLVRRYPPGFCQTCGYSLRGLPEARCPECGTEFDSSSLPSLPGDRTDI